MVTGAGGFVGSAVVRLLVNRLETTSPKFWDGTRMSHVVALLRPGGSLERLEELKDSQFWSKEYSDVTNGRALEQIVSDWRPRAIIHCALDRRAYRELTETERKHIIDAPLRSLLTGLAESGEGRFIQTGSARVLRAGEDLDESSEIAPSSVYGIHKSREDRLLCDLGKTSVIEWINLRLFYLFGKYERLSRLLPYLVSCHQQGKVARLSNGKQIRDFSNVDDVALAYLLALQAPESACGQVYHIGSGRGISIRRIAEIVTNMTGTTDLIEFDAHSTEDESEPCIVSNPGLAQRILGWQGSNSTESEIRDMTKWWLDRWSIRPENAFSAG